MFPTISALLIVGTCWFLAWQQPGRVRFISLVIRLVIALLIGLMIASIDFLIALSIGDVDQPEKYFEWGYPQFAVNCIALALVIYAAINASSAKPRKLTTLLASSLLGFWLTNAGLYWAIRSVFEYGSFGFGEFLENLVSIDRMTSGFFLRGALIYSAASIAFLFILVRSNSTSKNHHSTTNQEVVVRFKSSPNEPARLLMGMAAAGRLSMIGKLRDEQEHPCLPAPFSMDVDRSELIKLADKRDQEVATNRVWYLVLAVVGLVLISSDAPGAVVLVIIAASIVVLRQSRRDRNSLVPAYQPNVFKPPTPPDSEDSFHNLVTFAGSDPFSQFGFRFGSWVLVVDTARSKQGDLEQRSLTDPDIDLIEAAISQSMMQGGQIVGTPRSLYFVQGANIPEDIKREGAIRPPESLSDERFAKHADDPDSPVRRYLWIRKSIWGREITISYFVRIFRHGTDLNLEINGIIMPPVAAQFRWIDQFAPQGFWGLVFEFLGSLFIGAWMLVWTPIELAGKIQEGMAEATGGKERAKRRLQKSIERTANFDFGAPLSIRRQVADFGPVQYFQDMDRRSAEAAFAGRVMRSFIDYLDECNIDTSELREQRTTLLNQGIVVQGGDVKAENMAVGAGASVKAIGQQARNKLGASK